MGLAAFPKPGGDHHRGAGAALTKFSDEPRNDLGRCADDSEIWADGEALDIRVSQHALDSLMLGIDWHDRAIETALEEIACQHRAHRGRRLAGTDEGNRSRFEQVVEIADGHKIASLIYRGSCHILAWSHCALHTTAA